MTARKRLDEMKQFMKITESAWDLPRTKEDFDSLAATLTSNDPNLRIHERLFNILGDDDLNRRLGQLDPHGFDAPEVIIQWMKDQRKNPRSNFPNIWNTYQLSQQEDSPMNEVGRTSLDDYREETDDEWEARVSQPPIEDEYEDEEYAPIVRGKSDIMKKWGAEQSKEVTDLSLSEVGDVKFDDYGAVPVYEDDPEPECSYCDDEEPLDGVPCLNCGSLQYVDEDRDEDSLGHYTVTLRTSYEESELSGPLPYPEAIDKAKEWIKWNEEQATGDIVTTRKDKDREVWFEIFDMDMDEAMYVVVEPTDPADVEAWFGENISLESIAESVLQEYPGQPKDFYDEGDEFEKLDKDIDIATRDYDTNKIDPEIEDDELGFRFD